MDKKDMTTIRVSRRLVFATRTIAAAEGRDTSIEDIIWRSLWETFPDKMELVEQLAPVEGENGNTNHLDARD